MEHQQPHVLLLPFPAQGHVTPMLNLAQLLSHAGIHVTFLSTEHNHRLLTQRQALSARFPTLHFESIPDGLPPDHPRIIPPIDDLVSSLRSVTKRLLRDLLISLTKRNDESYSYDDDDASRRGRPPPLGCVITDGIMCFAVDVAEELGIPIMALRTTCASNFLSYICIPTLIQQGQLPFSDDNMDQTISGIPGLEGLLRCRDLPSFCRKPINDPTVRFFLEETQAITRVSAVILNTFEDLEPTTIPHIALLFPRIYTIGPIHTLLKSRAGVDNLSSSASSLRQEDHRCMTWLDSQKLGSAIFVSFGSLAKLTRGELLEFWYGLVNAGKPFLWVVRSDMLWGEQGEHVIPEELEVGTKERGFIVKWAPQEEVLAHGSVGGFLTHSGWNSTLEGIWAGVPMLCWPQLADQQVNSRLVGEVWKIGLDMKDTCDRFTVEKMVRALMEENDQRKKILKSMEGFSKLAHRAVSESGSSYNNMDKLIEDIRNL